MNRQERNSSAISGPEKGPLVGADDRLFGVRIPRLLWLVLSLQLVLALFAQWGRVYLDDEIGTWRAVQGSFGTIVTSFDEWQTHPAYFLAAKLCTLPFGISEWVLRLPALVTGLLLTSAVYGLISRLVDVRAGFFAAVLVGLHPFVVFYSQMARGYSMAMALALISLLCIQRLAAGEGGRWTGIACLLARAISVYAHLGACATIVAEVILAVSVTRAAPPDQRRTRLLHALAWVTGGGLLAILFYLPLLPGILEFRERWTGESLGGFTLGFVPLVARVFAGGYAFGLGFIGLAGLCGLAVLLRQRTTCGTGLALLLGSLAVVGFYGALDTAHYPWAFARFLTPALPLLLATAGIGLGLVARRFPQPSIAALLLVLIGVAYRDSLKIAFGPKDLPWSQVLGEIATPERRTLVLAPVRFQGSEPYLDLLMDSGTQLVGIEKLPDIFAQGGLKTLANRRLTILADVIDFDSLEGSFELHSLGSTTRLDRAPCPDDPLALVEALRAFCQVQIDYLEPKEAEPISGHWVFWRLDTQHEHPFAATTSHVFAQALLAMTCGLLERNDEAQIALDRSRALREAIPVPGAVRSAW